MVGWHLVNSSERPRHSQFLLDRQCRDAFRDQNASIKKIPISSIIWTGFSSRFPDENTLGPLI
jgi:hypothetical protein